MLADTEFLHEDAYPNLPEWLSPARVYLAWIGMTLCVLFEVAKQIARRVFIR